jgi:phosphate transport system substrate-binding protein
MKKIVFAVSVLLFAAVMMVPVFAGGQKDAEAGPAPYTIEVTGSTSVAPLMETLAEAYKSVVPSVTINVSGTGSSDGITGANTGVAELGMSSRNLRSAELGYGLDADTIAIDAIAVVVHPDNPVSDLTLDQVNGIYTGSVTNWSQVGGPDNPISVVSREPGSGTRGAFEEIVEFKDQLVAGAIEFDGTGGVRAAVAGNVNAVGYISLGSMSDEVKSVKIGGVEASVDNVINNTFPIARPFLVLYFGDKIDPATRSFLDWVMTADIQKSIVAKKGYVPVK